MSKVISKVAPVAGGVIGGVFGGPAGAAVGSGIGGAVGGMLGDSAPKFDSKSFLDDQIKAGTFGVDSPLGNINITRGPSGEIVRSFDQSSADETRNALISQGLGGINMDPTKAEDAYFNMATRQLLPQFERQTESLDENLINRGIGIGTEQYGHRMGDLEDRQQGTLSDLANQSVFAGQDLLGSQIGNVGALAGQRDIYGLSNLGSNVGNTGFGSSYELSLADKLARQQESAGGISSLANLGGLIGGFMGGK